MADRQQRLYAALTAAFAPTMIEIVDDSSRHAGHAGASPSGETHYTVKMVAAAFAGQSRIASSRAVHEVLADEFRHGLHALSLTLRATKDADRA